LINEDPITEAEFYAQIGEAYFKLNNAKLGKENYQKALQFDQTNYLTKNNFALRLARSGSDLDLAEKLIDEVINTTEKTADFYTTKAVVKFAKESYNEALAIAEIAVQLDNNDATAQEVLGNCYAKVGKIEDALNCWRKAQTLGAKNNDLDKKIQTKQYVAPVY